MPTSCTVLPLGHWTHCVPEEPYHAARFEKNTRYYVMRLSKDLLDDWVITLINGRIKTKLGQIRTLAFAHYVDAFDHFCLLTKVRHQRGYQLKTYTCDHPHWVQLVLIAAICNAMKPVMKTKSTGQRQNQNAYSLPNSMPPHASEKQMGFVFGL